MVKTVFEIFKYLQQSQQEFNEAALWPEMLLESGTIFLESTMTGQIEQVSRL